MLTSTFEPLLKIVDRKPELAEVENADALRQVIAQELSGLYWPERDLLIAAIQLRAKLLQSPWAGDHAMLSLAVRIIATPRIEDTLDGIWGD